MNRTPYHLSLAILAALILAVGVAQGAEPCWCRVANPVVSDADTIHGDVILPWGVTLRGESMRAADYDAAETSKRRRSVEVTDAEVEVGLKAASSLKELMDGGTLYASPVERTRDVYGRLLAKFRVVTKAGERIELGEWMSERGYLRTK